MTDRAARQNLFLSELIEAGHYRDLGRPGVWGRSAAFESVFEGLTEAVRRQFAAADPTEISFGPLETQCVFERSGYIESFPQLIGSVAVFTGDDAAHKELLHEREAGEPWDSHLAPSGLMMVSAACHPLYGMLAGSVVDDDRYTVGGWCFRHEPSDDPFRTIMFRQREIVMLGRSEFVVEERNSWMNRSEELLTRLGLDVRREVANDPFFGRAGRLMARGQRANALKVELTIASYGEEHSRTALASGNAHGTHFADSFDLRLPDGSRAHSACMGFGLERVVLSLFKSHGMDPLTWPDGVRSELGLATRPHSRPRRVPQPALKVGTPAEAGL